ncbi:MAG: hypothetical protein P8M04_00685 [Akkermansiaceae bacterium]|nr:hypothetical protein [Akkermansiaceae bacterium]
MKVAFFMWGLMAPLQALPNAVLGALAKHDSPLNGEDLTAVLLASGVWDGSKPLPGEWEADAGIANVSSAYLMARPKVFGVQALLVRALKRKGQLEELQITFADAGSFFGYLDRRIPDGMSSEEAAILLQERVEQRKIQFEKLYARTAEELGGNLKKIDERPRDFKRGRTRGLRAIYRQFEYKESGLLIQLLEAKDRLLRVRLRKRESAPKSWLDASQEELGIRARLKALSAKVTKTDRGDVILNEVEVVPQGYRPYCGLNTLVMVARYLGLHLDEDWLAVAGKFQNTGSAAGSDMLGLYSSVAREARFNLNRASDYDHEIVRRSIRAGMPVIVWRRWDRQRDHLHTRISRDFDKGRDQKYERPSEEVMPSKKKRSPLHASVIVGYNDERREVIFLESWEGLFKPRRMLVNEISHTADLTFSFRP